MSLQHVSISGYLLGAVVELPSIAQHWSTAESRAGAAAVWRRNPRVSALLEKKRNRYYLVLVSYETGFLCEFVERQGKSSLKGEGFVAWWSILIQATRWSILRKSRWRAVSVLSFQMEAATEWLGVCVETTSGIAVDLVQKLTQQSSATGSKLPAKPARHVSHEKPPVIAATTSFAMVAGITFGAGGAMFASSALLGTICAAGLYCRVYWVFISSASRRRPGLGGKEENAVTVAAVLMLCGYLCTNWLGSLFQLCISLLAMVAHLRWVAAGTGLGQYYGGDEPESTLEQLLWSSAADQDNQLKHAVALVCPGSTLMALATCSLITQNPVLFGIFLVESRISLPHQMDTRGRWKPDSYWRAVLYEQAKVMSRIDPDLVESAGGTTRAFAQRFELSQLELEPDGKMWWRGCGRQASGQCDSLRLTATLGLNNPPCCRSHLTSMIEQISSLMNELSLPHWIDGSTLLAAVRHKMIMPWCSSASFTFVPPVASQIMPG